MYITQQITQNEKIIQFLQRRRMWIMKTPLVCLSAWPKYISGNKRVLKSKKDKLKHLELNRTQEQKLKTSVDLRTFPT